MNDQKEYVIWLTEEEINLLISATEAESSNAKIQMLKGLRDNGKTQTYTKRLCEINLKLYQKMLSIHRTA